MTISKRMKKILSYILAAASVFLAAACVEEAGKWEPSIQLSSTSVQLSAEGSMQKIVYQVQNVADPEEIYVSYDADWLTVSTLKAKLIEVSATKNESGAERKATLTVTYPGLEDVLVEVSQAAWNAPIVLTVNGTESTSVSFSVITSSDDLTWVGQVVGIG